MPDHRLERGEDLLVGEVAGRAEEDQGIGLKIAHRLFTLFAFAVQAQTLGLNDKVTFFAGALLAGEFE